MALITSVLCAPARFVLMNLFTAIILQNFSITEHEKMVGAP